VHDECPQNVNKRHRRRKPNKEKAARRRLSIRLLDDHAAVGADQSESRCQ
jgi:hypothetical protein